MKHTLVITLLLLPLFFSGTSVPGNGCMDCGAIQQDTAKLKEAINHKIDSIVNIHISRLEVVKQELIDSINELPKKRKLWMGIIDREERPDGSAYEWRWWYVIFRDDTLFYKVDIVRVK